MTDATSPQPSSSDRYRDLYEYAPISLWEEDYSSIKRQFDRLRAQGIDSLATHLAQHPDVVEKSMQQIVVRSVNRATLDLFKASSQKELVANLGQIFRAEMRQHFQHELLALWDGNLSWTGEGVNYTLTGEALDILLHWRILPGCEHNWESVLVTIEDITARRQAERRLHDLFEAAPISLWEEDYRDLKAFFDELRHAGVEDLPAYLDAHPETVAHCIALIRVLDVNQKTVDLFGADSKAHLLANLAHIFRDGMQAHFERELVDLWQGRLAYSREGINYALTGEPVAIQLDLRVMPGHEQDFGWVLVALQDITARKKAEDYLYYLGTHDVLTGLHNRTYFQETLHRLRSQCSDPITFIIADLNGLKQVNDSFGHEAGDNLLRRAAEVLRASMDDATIVARIGGDEFVVVLPAVAASAAGDAVQRIRTLVELNNKYYHGTILSIALGVATSRSELTLEDVIRNADDAMYRDKESYYRQLQQRSQTDQIDRRRP